MNKPKFRIPYQDLCPKCKAILKQRKKEYFRFYNRVIMANSRKKELAKKK